MRKCECGLRCLSPPVSIALPLSLSLSLCPCITASLPRSLIYPKFPTHTLSTPLPLLSPSRFVLTSNAFLWLRWRFVKRHHTRARANANARLQASAALGMREIIITAHHEGGFALWPSKFTPYSVAASSWRGGKGDVLREFADAANKWGIGISYYLNVQDDGYMMRVANYSDAEFIRRQVGMVTEVLTNYGPVNRFWFDGTKDFTGNLTDLWDQVYVVCRNPP